MKYFNSLTNQIEEVPDRIQSEEPIFNMPSALKGGEPTPMYTIKENMLRPKLNNNDVELGMYERGPAIDAFGNIIPQQKPLVMPTQGFDEQSQQVQTQADGQTVNQNVDRSQLVGQSPTFYQNATQVMPSQLARSMGGSGFGTFAQGIKNEMLAGQDQAKMQADYYKGLEQNALKIDNDYKNQIAQMEQKKNEQIQKIENATAEIQKQAEINPNRFFQNLSTGQKIQAGIAVALSGLGAALQGSNRNMALERIDDAINKDIMAQETGLKAKKDSLAASQSLLGTYSNQLGDVNAAKDLAKRDMYKIAEIKLQQQFNGLNGPVQTKLMGQYQQQLGQLQLKQQEYNQAAMSKLVSQVQTQQVLSGQGVQNPFSLPEEMRKNLVKVGDKYMVATSGGTQKDIEEKLPAMNNVQDKARQVLNLIESGGTKTLNREKMATIGTIMGDMGTSYSRMKGLGSYDEGTAKLITKIQGDPTSITSLPSSDKAKLKSLINLVETDKQNLLKQGTIGYKGIK